MKSLKWFALFTMVAAAALASTPAMDMFIPAVANSPGAFGTQWSSDVRIYNPNATDLNVTIVFTAMQALGGGTQTESVLVSALSTKEYENILLDLFALSNTAGALHLTATANFLAESRTFTPGTVGTFGQRIPGIPAFQALMPGDSTDLLYIDNSDHFRTNLGLLDASGTGATATLQAYDGAGAPAGAPYPVTLLASEPKQLNGILGVLGLSSGSNYRVNILVTTGKVIAYASQVDNDSGDPIFVDGSIAKVGGGPAGCMTTGAYYGYSTFTTNPSYDWLVSPFAPTLVDGKLEGFALMGTDHKGQKYVWPVFWSDVYFDPPLDLALTPNVPFSTEFSITFTYEGEPDDCVTAAYTVGGVWDGCSKINQGTINIIWTVLAGKCKTDLGDIMGKFDYSFEAGIDPAMGPVAMSKRMPLKKSEAHRIR